ncbi:MAG: 4-(cytidine 5'-diphospho)-2-C-methyl-D-erythritol kinase [Candidatus Palauibacterales bacterium]|nr:4-(cytidine 5'-diphospho)-2-C-methyl-D-erythritol kinase [Candidatus Palauibacterales bacterium]MDP2482143.1 4-(cytidine 5'-diphospho)-2-C-methyl-D-erythritol kinase [Candidatus Palauibacterales bacterium]
MTRDPPRADAPGLPLLAHAKLNVSLRVLAREDSGYHSVETILVRLELADRLWIESTPTPGIRLQVTGEHEAPTDSDNLCWRAADLMRRAVGRADGVAMLLEKLVPAGAGLGGGSADAAAVLRGLNELWGRPLAHASLVRLAGELGSDVPFGLCDASMALAWERGRRMLPLQAPTPWHVAIVVPGFPIRAPDAYAWLDEDRAAGRAKGPEPAQLPFANELSDSAVLAQLASNDLEGPVFRRHPELMGIRDSLLDLGAAVALLCGSGSCVAGLFSDETGVDRATRALVGREGTSIVRTRTLA